MLDVCVCVCARVRVRACARVCVYVFFGGGVGCVDQLPCSVWIFELECVVLCA